MVVGRPAQADHVHDRPRRNPPVSAAQRRSGGPSKRICVPALSLSHFWAESLPDGYALLEAGGGHIHPRTKHTRWTPVRGGFSVASNGDGARNYFGSADVRRARRVSLVASEPSISI